MTIVFTDLDGTLLDHHTYSPHKAERVIKWLSIKKIPLIFCSSKTFDEQIYIQDSLGICAPFIFENGCGVAFPKDYFPLVNQQLFSQQQGRVIVPLVNQGIAAIQQALGQVKAMTGELLRGFSTTREEEVGLVTQLEGEAIARARQRMFTETLLPPVPTRASRNALRQQGFSLSEGGRFFSVQQAGADKGKAVRWLTALYRFHWHQPIHTIGIGDSPNDTAMLEAVHRAYQVQRHDGQWHPMEIPGLVKIPAIGPEGFAQLPLLLEPLVHQGRI